VRRRWDEVLANLPSPRAQAFISQNAHVLSFEEEVLTLGFAPAVVDNARRGDLTTIQNAFRQAFAVTPQVSIVARTSDSGQANVAPLREPDPEPEPEPDPEPAPSFDEADAAWLAGVPLTPPDISPQPDVVPDATPAAVRVVSLDATPAAAAQPPVGLTPGPVGEREPEPIASEDDSEDDEYSNDDVAIESTALVGVPLAVQVLKGEIISETINEG
jgi:DNA polymerase-3 subunit gamma/tau